MICISSFLQKENNYHLKFRDSGTIMPHWVMRLILGFYTISVLNSCDTPEKKITGLWQIDTAYYNKQPVVYDLSPGVFDLQDGNSCDLPVSQQMKKNPLTAKGTWTAYERKDTIYLQIETKNIIFNRTFKVSSYLKKTRGTSSLTKILLLSDSIKLACSRVIF